MRFVRNPSRNCLHSRSDHNHSKAHLKTRGLLCSFCNRHVVGTLDNPVYIRGLVTYLLTWEPAALEGLCEEETQITDLDWNGPPTRECVICKQLCDTFTTMLSHIKAPSWLGGHAGYVPAIPHSGINIPPEADLPPSEDWEPYGIAGRQVNIGGDRRNTQEVLGSGVFVSNETSSTWRAP